MSAKSETHGGEAHQIALLPRISIQAFCETADMAEVIQAAGNDRRMSKTHLKIQMGGVAAAAEAYRNAPTPNVIIIENIHARAELIEGLDRLSEFCDPGTKVVIIGHINDVLLYRELVRRGVSEYIIAPLTAIELVKGLSELFHSPGAAHIGRTTAFIGAKGGVGASTVCHNVAWAVARSLKLDTVIVDLDLPFGTAGLDFNQDPSQGLADLVYAPDRVDAGLVDRLLAKCADHLSLLAAPATLDRLCDFQEDAFDAILDILRGNVPAIMLDVPHVWTGWARRLVAGADEIVMVATPDLASLRNTKSMLDLMRQARKNDSPPRLVLNMVNVPKRPEIKAADFAKQLDIEPAAIIPFEPAMFGTAANNGQMIAEVSAASKTAEMFLATAHLITGRMEVRKPKRSGIPALFNKLQRKKA